MPKAVRILNSSSFRGRSRATTLPASQRGGATAVVNIDDNAADAFLEAARSAGAKVLRVTRDANREAEIHLGKTDISIQGTRGELHLPDASTSFELPLLGDFNLENLLVATGAAVAMGVTSEAIAKGIAHHHKSTGHQPSQKLLDLAELLR